MRVPKGCVPLVLALMALPSAVATGPAEKTVVKLATLVPDGSVWHKVLIDLGEDWSRDTQGRVSLRIYPGGVAGDEPDMVRKMRIGQIQASALTVLGLADIDDSFLVFAIPMFFDSYDELLYVVDRMAPTLKKRLEAKGFVLLNWGHAGWVYFFSKQPIQTVSDLKRVKMWVSAGDDRMVQMWKDAGFQPVALSATDIQTGLQTGMIDALPMTPLGILVLQWFRTTPHMVDAGMAPLVGGLVITRQQWNKISPADRPKMLEACLRGETRLKTEIPKQDETAMAEMQKRGLQVTHVKPENLAEWHSLADHFAARMRGSMVPADILDLALRERNAFRQQHHP